MSDNTPTERVRELLDEHGVEHKDNDMNYSQDENYGVRITRWSNGGKRLVSYYEWANGTTRLDAGNVTPEQAIAVTVGAHSLNNPKVSDKVSDADELRTLVDALMLCDDVVHGDHDSCNECKLPGNGESRCLTMARRIGVFE